MDRPKLIDSVGNELELPKTFNVRSAPVGRRTAVLEAAYSDGAKDYSDGCFTPRRVEISGNLWAATAEEYNAKWDELAAFLVRENLRIQYLGRVIYTKRVEQINYTDPVAADIYFGKVALTFLCTDPFWYKLITQTKIYETGGTSPYQMVFAVDGNVPIFPRIKITNLANNTSFSFKNSSDGNRQFTFADAAALNGTVVDIDCAKGTVLLGTASKIESFSGLFLRLLGGQDNTIVYTGANAKIEIFFREAWL